MKIAISSLAFLLLILVSFNAIAQDPEKDDPDKCVGKGKITIEPYYGYPYLFGKYVQTVIDVESGSNIDIVNTNHLGFKGEYMITKMIGLGLDYTYASVIARYVETNNLYNSNTGTYYTQVNNYTARIVKQRFLAKINIHFATSKYLDPYAVGGIGYKQSIVSSNNINDQEAVDALNNSFLNVFPVSFRLGAGVRYYFIKNLGIAVEAGIGGPIIQGGITAKF